MIYVVVNKASGEPVWINPHPFDGLTEKEVWADFDPALHDLVRSPFFPKAIGLPWGNFDESGEPHFKTENGRLRELTLDEKYDAGIIPRPVEPQPGPVEPEPEEP